MAANTYGRQTVVSATNKSGGALIVGDVCVVDTANNLAFTTNTAGAFTGTIGIAQGSIANNAVGLFATAGYVALVNVNASVTRGNYGKTHTVAKQATDAGSSRGVGTFCEFTTGGTTPDAIMWPVDLLGSSLTNPMTTTGDVIYSSDGSGTPARLAIGAVGTKLVGGTTPSYVGFIGCKAYHSTTESFVASANRAMLMDSEFFDTNAFHFTSAAALTGTVAKAAASPSIVGTGTAFTTELTVNQVISIPGTATEIGVVKTITDNTHLDFWANMANTASGQTATRRNEYVAIPAGFPTNGKWRLSGGTYWGAYTGSAVSYVIVDHFGTGTDNAGFDQTFVGCLGYHMSGSSIVQASPGDYFDLRALNGSSATASLGSSGTSDAATHLLLEFVGA